ncbi:MAG: tryptophan synthase subunit alpha, partial [Thermodesulfobacteriota bacterium]|nr:tryptophan synthase subunit alpha [Thermodesulfobacteriota bacterium]
MTMKIQEAFAAAKKAGRRAFIPYVTGEFPDRAACLELILALDQAGADIIEIGVPFSDPLADGPTIQHSSKLALDSGVSPESVLEMTA